MTENLMTGDFDMTEEEIVDMTEEEIEKMANEIVAKFIQGDIEYGRHETTLNPQLAASVAIKLVWEHPESL